MHLISATQTQQLPFYRARYSHHFMQGVSSLKFTLVLIIMSVMSYFLMQGLIFIQGKSERRAFEDNHAALERAISYELMSRGTRGETIMPDKLLKENPFQWLASKPLGWSGIYPASGQKKSGAWYWDNKKNEIVYVPKDPSLINFDDKKQSEIRLRLSLIGQGQATLLAANKYQWK